jgi:hypothetical protein
MLQSKKVGAHTLCENPGRAAVSDKTGPTLLAVTRTVDGHALQVARKQKTSRYASMRYQASCHPQRCYAPAITVPDQSRPPRLLQHKRTWRNPRQNPTCGERGRARERRAKPCCAAECNREQVLEDASELVFHRRNGRRAVARRFPECLGVVEARKGFARPIQ